MFNLLKEEICMFINYVYDLLEDQSGEVDEKAVLMVVLVLGTIAGIGVVAARVNGLLNTAAAGM